MCRLWWFDMFKVNFFPLKSSTNKLGIYAFIINIRLTIYTILKLRKGASASELDGWVGVAIFFVFVFLVLFLLIDFYSLLGQNQKMINDRLIISLAVSIYCSFKKNALFVFKYTKTENRVSFFLIDINPHFFF